MEFNKNYTLPKRRSEHITLFWNRGYMNVEVHLEGEKIHEINNRQELVKGVSFENERLGKIEVFFAGSKYELGIKVEGYESPTNRYYPTKEVDVYRNLFLLPGFCHLVILCFLAYQITQSPEVFRPLLYFPLAIQIFSLILYIVVTILLYKKIPIGYLIGTGYNIGYGIWAFLIPLILGGFFHLTVLMVIISVLYFVYSIFLISKVKPMLRAHRHWKLERQYGNNEELLDI